MFFGCTSILPLKKTQMSRRPANGDFCRVFRTLSGET
uniref:Uncharacterized protein n=1 Tax=Rhizophora mucronata TaxID=61149 RepID=A0A2P2NCB1_RHIMU